MSKPSETITINIDNQFLQVGAGKTILQAAEQNHIYIPTLCAYKDLTPFGGCRMCIVEVDGLRGFPTACTTPVVEGMNIRTNTVQLQNIRSEILQLILSEHPCSCLICDEQEECKEFSGTIRKATVTTGCRYCPNDGQCELAEVAKKVGVKEINYPINYRYYRVEREDPFYDRDYNLCILCGRCIRMCQEIRAANALTFKQRGQKTVIGPAYNRTHIEAGCEFCGACVSICPTGALSEKTRKWEGKAEREEITTCALCGVGCQVHLQIKGRDIIGALPADDPLINNGQLCVKGRFCIPELINNHQRLKKPYRAHDGLKIELTFEQAIEEAAKKLAVCPPNEFGMIVSQNITNEDLYIAQKFTRAVMGSNNIDTMARIYYGAGLNNYVGLMKSSATLESLRKAATILCIGLDTRYGGSVVGVELRMANRKGAKIITINSHPHNLSIVAHTWLKPESGEEVGFIQSLARLIGKAKSKRPDAKSETKPHPSDNDIETAARILAESSSVIILIGSDVFKYLNSPKVLEEIGKLARSLQAEIMPLPAQNNFNGALLMGAYPELLPGGFSSARKDKQAQLGEIWGSQIPDWATSWNAEAVMTGKRMKILYLIGEVPLRERPASDFLIFQNLYPPESIYRTDLVLPSAAFTEIDGTFINGEGRLQRVRKAVEPPGFALPDWKILCLIAQKMGKKGFDFDSVDDVHKEISCQVNGFSSLDNIKRETVIMTLEPACLTGKSDFAIDPYQAPDSGKANMEFPYLLHTAISEHTYRGFPLASYVEGLKKLFIEATLEISPEDAKKAGLISGDEVIVTSAKFEKTWPARIMAEQTAGILHVTLPQGEVPGRNPYPVRIRKKNV
ncbi:MAG: molybdopterin-dependent oxidoreductase [candidate division Zixibacteria bacterium]|nr:molybdopterin-dependent oxidoreductase [candidate division Zixibacteria bacterium]